MFRLAVFFVTVFAFAVSAQAGLFFNRHQESGCTSEGCHLPAACGPTTTAPIPAIPPVPAASVCAPAACAPAACSPASEAKCGRLAAWNKQRPHILPWRR